MTTPSSDHTEPASLPRRDALRRLGAGGLAAGLLLGATQAIGGAQSAVTSASTEAAARRAINAVNLALSNGDVSVLNLSFDPAYVNHTPARSYTTGELGGADLAGLGATITQLRGVIPNAKLLVEDVVAMGDTAAIRVEFRGDLDTAQVALPEGVSPRLIIGGIAMLRIVNGLVTESWQYGDAAEQLGVPCRPAASPTPEPATPTPTPAPAAATPGEVRQVSDFAAIQLQGVGQMQIVQGDSEYLTIEAEDKVLKRITSEVQDGVLHIYPARDFQTNEAVIYHVGVKTLGSLAVAGSSSATADALTADELLLDASAATAISIGALTATALRASLSGNAKVTLAGTVERQEVTVQGSSQYDAANLASADATISVSGASQAQVQASATLTADASGASTITYSGPAAVTPTTSGASRITQAG
ncbi:MAG: DUF2807 domain-containing protein [Thermomicrobiales bacterium]